MNAIARESKVDESFCTARLWLQEANRLREILLECDVTAEFKWGKPPYSYTGKNICIIQRMKDFLAFSFFKGAVLKDSDAVPERQGPNSRACYRMRFTSVQQVASMANSIKGYLQEAIEIEIAGLKAETTTDFECLEELIDVFEADPDFKASFDELAPDGNAATSCILPVPSNRRHGHRIEKYRREILDGKGLHHRQAQCSGRAVRSECQI